MPLYAAVEGGGQSWRVAVADGSPDNIIAFKQIPSVNKDPSSILGEIKTFLDQHKYDSLGISTFGPIDSNPDSDTYGYLLGTPNKPLWRNVDVVGHLWNRRVPCRFVSDVAGPCLAEYTLGAAAGQTSCSYITVGTGVNAGFVVNGQITQGLVNSEAGHTPLPERPGFSGEAAMGACRLHKGGCVSGVAGATGISLLSQCERGSLHLLEDDHPVWDRVAHALGTLCFSIAIYLSPSKIVLNGGVLQRACLFPMVRSVFRNLMQGFLQHSSFEEGLDHYIIPATWGQKTGIVGALSTAKLALDTAETMHSIKRLCQLKASLLHLDTASSVSLPTIDEHSKADVLTMPEHLSCVTKPEEEEDKLPYLTPFASVPTTPLRTPRPAFFDEAANGECLSPSLENFWDRSHHGLRPPPTPLLSLGLSLKGGGMAFSGSFEVAGSEERDFSLPPAAQAVQAVAVAPDPSAPLAQAVAVEASPEGAGAHHCGAAAAGLCRRDTASSLRLGRRDTATSQQLAAELEGPPAGAGADDAPVKISLVLRMTNGYLAALVALALACVVGYRAWGSSPHYHMG